MKAKRKKESEFTKGYVCAVACILRTHDEPVVAADVLRCNRPDDWSQIDEYDREIIEKAGLLREDS